MHTNKDYYEKRKKWLAVTPKCIHNQMVQYVTQHIENSPISIYVSQQSHPVQKQAVLTTLIKLTRFICDTECIHIQNPTYKRSNQENCILADFNIVCIIQEKTQREILIVVSTFLFWQTSSKLRKLPEKFNMVYNHIKFTHVKTSEGWPRAEKFRVHSIPYIDSSSKNISYNSNIKKYFPFCKLHTYEENY